MFRCTKKSFFVDITKRNSKIHVRGVCSSPSLKSSLRIGCASGFWGDTPTAVPQLVHKGKLQFLVLDFLSEITMSLLAAAKNRVPTLGYVPDMVEFVGPCLSEIKRQGIRIVSNAGGINVDSCVQALSEASKKAGVNLRIAAVSGDDLMPIRESLFQSNIREMASGLSLPQTINSMNAYLGAVPIARALAMGADIVVTGRCTDSALVLGPLMNHFQWSAGDLDKLAAGSLAGHLIECGAQATGGIHTDWAKVPRWSEIGFPIAECFSDGKFVISKPEGTGGIVTRGTVAEQLTYEIGDPSNYILPDVVCDFSNVQMEETRDGVLVQGAKGKPPTEFYKVCATYLDGFRATVVVPIGGPKAAMKGRKTAEQIISRCRAIFQHQGIPDFQRVNIQVIGAEDSYGANANPQCQDIREAVMWMAVHHQDKRAIQIFGREIAPAATGMAPGFTTLVGGRPKAVPLLRLFSFLYPKDKLNAKISLDNKEESYVFKQSDQHGSQTGDSTTASDVNLEVKSGQMSYRLEDLAYTRSGDKGDTGNIGVIARHPKYFPYLMQALTEESVGNYMSHLFKDGASAKSCIKRYALPGIHAMNFVLDSSLGGGGIASLRFDPQGKAYGQMLLDYRINNIPSLEEIQKES